MKRLALSSCLIFAACSSSQTAGPASGPAKAAEVKVDKATLLAGPMWASADAVRAHCTRASATVDAQRSTVKASPARSRTGTLDPYNQMMFALDEALGTAGLVANVHPDEKVREAAEGCERELQKMISDINLDRKMFDAVSGVDAASLDDGGKRFRKKILTTFRRSGVDKDDATRKKLEQLNEEMVRIGQAFSRTIRNDSRTITVDAKLLDGLPADFIAGHKPNAEGKVRLSTDYPDFFPVQKYAKSEALRKQLYVEFLSRGYPQNDDNLKKLLELRSEYAKLLGFESWAAYTAEDKMVKTDKRIASFIADIAKVARPRMDADLKTLLKRKKKDDKKAKAVQVWDRFYYTQLVQKEQFGFDVQAVRPYFEYKRVTKGIQDLYAELFGVTFKKVEGAPVWHPSVEAYELLENGQVKGRFYLDMHPRDGKYGHAAMFPLRVGLSGSEQPAASLVCNFPNPSEGEALMEHSQVVTYFHEFGHLVHHLLATDSPWANQGGINTEWDFVEAPSQLLEEWAWDPAVLQRFAKHAKTNEAIPADVVKKMRASSEFGKGVHVMRQVALTALSFELHSEADPSKLELEAKAKDVAKRYSPYPYPEGTHQYASFGHLNGYSSMYYTYQWSLSLAKDIFTRFEKEGLLNQAVAQAYVQKILRPGGARDASELVKEFLGREPNLDAYRKWLQAN